MMARASVLISLERLLQIDAALVCQRCYSRHDIREFIPLFGGRSLMDRLS